MNIDEAIKILEVERGLAERQPETGVFDALKLGIEALKRIELGRTGVQRFAHSLLPGETKD